MAYLTTSPSPLDELEDLPNLLEEWGGETDPSPATFNAGGGDGGGERRMRFGTVVGSVRENSKRYRVDHRGISNTNDPSTDPKQPLAQCGEIGEMRAPL